MLAHHYAQALEYARDAGQPTDELELRTRLALRDAADRAPALSSLTAAQQHYAAALALWPRDDPDWPELVIATADAGLGMTSDEMSRGPGARHATGWRRRAISAGAAKAEMLSGFRYWNEARAERALAAFAAARRA